MFDKLEKIESRFEALEQQIATPEVAMDPHQLQSLAQERAKLEDVVNMYREYKAVSKQLEETREMLNTSLDEDMQSLVRTEIADLESKFSNIHDDLRLSLLPKDPNDEKSVIVEIRAGTGGDEAAIFAADLYRMYTRYAQSKGWKVDVISASESVKNGFKEIIFEVQGKRAFSRLKFERGVHRVQRVPITEASGRIHTSTATVAVLPEADEVDISVNPEDLRVDIFHSGGAGGQNVNKVATAVRLTHIPTSMVVVCQDERSQLRNRQKAMAVLRARLLDTEQSRQQEEISQERRSQVGTGERSEKIRTYNFPQDRLTDHRIGVNMHNLPSIMEGDIDELIDALATSEQSRLLEEQAV
jgi:peptide chain release factor 1